MPKETIYGDGLPYGTPEDPGPARSVVELSWSREAEHVQLVTKCVEASTLEVYRPREGEPGFDARRGPVEAQVAATLADAGIPIESDFDYREGFYVTLDRYGINRLIRHLRRARDQAYGRDE